MIRRVDMLIETTININYKALLRVCRVAGKLGRSRRTIMSWLLGRLSDDRDISPVSWSRIRYQKRDISNNWENPHLYLTPAEYELFLDLKKVYKMSGSYLIAYAIEKYITELLHKKARLADNYRFTNYGLSRFIIKGVVCWTLYWGIPPRLIKKPPPHP